MGKSTHYFGQPLFSQVIKLLDKSKIFKISREHGGEHYTKRFTVWVHLIVMLYAVIKRFDSLREITTSLLAETNRLVHLGIDIKISRSTLADAFIDPECGEEAGTVITLSADTKDIWCFIQLPVGGLPPCNSKTGADSAGNTTGIVDTFRKGKIFFSGYNPYTQKFQIHEFLIDSVLERANLHARYISGARW